MFVFKVNNQVTVVKKKLPFVVQCTKIHASQEVNKFYSTCFTSCLQCLEVIMHVVIGLLRAGGFPCYHF